jgi:hypothetical protein
MKNRKGGTEMKKGRNRYEERGSRSKEKRNRNEEREEQK